MGSGFHDGEEAEFYGAELVLDFGGTLDLQY